MKIEFNLLEVIFGTSVAGAALYAVLQDTSLKSIINGACDFRRLGAGALAGVGYAVLTKYSGGGNPLAVARALASFNVATALVLGAQAGIATSVLTSGFFGATYLLAGRF